MGRRCALCAPFPPTLSPSLPATPHSPRPSDQRFFSRCFVFRVACAFPLSSSTTSQTPRFSHPLPPIPCHPFSTFFSPKTLILYLRSRPPFLFRFRFSRSFSSSSSSSFFGDARSFILRRLDPSSSHPLVAAPPSSLIPVERSTSKDHHQDFRKNS